MGRAMGRAVGAAAAARCARLRLAPPPSAFAQHVLRVEVDELLEPDHEHVGRLGVIRRDIRRGEPRDEPSVVACLAVDIESADKETERGAAADRDGRALREQAERAAARDGGGGGLGPRHAASEQRIDRGAAAILEQPVVHVPIDRSHALLDESPRTLDQRLLRRLIADAAPLR